MKAAGLQLYRTEEDLSEYKDKLAGQSIVISGVFTHHSRDEYKELIEKNGGKNVGSISAKTSFILAGENMGPAKLEKAKKLLTTTACKINEISVRVGYLTAPSFTRVFKKSVGISPVEYRDRYGEKNNDI